MEFFENDIVATAAFRCSCWASDAHENQEEPSEDCGGMIYFSVVRASGHKENVHLVHVKFTHY